MAAGNKERHVEGDFDISEDTVLPVYVQRLDALGRPHAPSDL